MSNNNAKDWFYWTVNNIADLGELGIEESALNQCIKGLDFHFLVSQFLKIINFCSILKIRTKEQKWDWSKNLKRKQTTLNAGRTKLVELIQKLSKIGKCND